MKHLSNSCCHICYHSGDTWMNADQSTRFLMASAQDFINDHNLCLSDRQKTILSCCLHEPFLAYDWDSGSAGTWRSSVSGREARTAEVWNSPGRVWCGMTTARQVVQVASAKALWGDCAWLSNGTGRLPRGAKSRKQGGEWRGGKGQTLQGLGVHLMGFGIYAKRNGSQWKVLNDLTWSGKHFKQISVAAVRRTD